MIALECGLNTIVAELIQRENEDCDDGLLSSIAKNMVADRLACKVSIRSNKIVGKIAKHKRAVNQSEIQVNDAIAYRESNGKWEIIQFESIDKAVEYGSKHIDNLILLYNGSIVNWDLLNDSQAYYELEEQYRVVSLR